VYLAHVVTPAFIEIGDGDDLPVAPKPVTPPRPTQMAPAPPKAHRVGPSGKPANSRAVQRRADAKRYGRQLTVASVADAPSSIPEDVEADSDDLAAVVVRKTLRQMAAGKLAPTLRDGLTAQQLLDRRAEKAADRGFMLNLAMALAGGGREMPRTLLPATIEDPDDVIEGEFTEENLAPAHLRQG
jgi:hypothetical protein